MKNIYAIKDNVARAIVGPLICENADAVAIRMFSDLLGDKTLTIGQHPGDYDLLQLGYLANEEYESDVSGHPALPITHKIRLHPIAEESYRIVLSGSQWLAIQEKNTGA